MRAELGVWAPDLPDIRAPHLKDAQGCVPTKEGYAPFYALNDVSNALDGKCIGAYAARDVTQGAHAFAGDASKLYKYAGGAWTDYSKSGGYGPVSQSARWRWTVFGDRLIAVNGWYDAPQYIDMSTGTVFADLPGSPPQAQFVATYKEFVFLGALSTGGMTIKWSGFNNSEQWTAGTNQSDEQELADGGRITGLAATDVLYVFQERSIRRVLYTGDAAIMDIQKVSENIGCVEPASLIQVGTLMFFLSEDGWYQFDGSSLTPIGSDLFDDWFFTDHSSSLRYAMCAAADPRKKIVAWAYASTSSGSLPDTILFYHWTTGKASYVRMDLEFLFNSLTSGASRDDPAYASLSADDAAFASISSDDPFFSGGVFYLGAFDTTHKLSSFSGDALEAILETGDFSIVEGQRCGVHWVKLIANTIAATVKVGTRVRAGDAVSWGSAVAQQTSGRCPQRGADGFFHRARITIPEGETWTYANALEAEPNVKGLR